MPPAETLARRSVAGPRTALTLAALVATGCGSAHSPRRSRCSGAALDAYTIVVSGIRIGDGLFTAPPVQLTVR